MLSAEAIFDKRTRRLWLEFPDGNSQYLGICEGDLIKFLIKHDIKCADGWVPIIGTQRSCIVTLPDAA